MLRKFATTLAAFAMLTVSATALADQAWWAEDDRNVEYSNYSDRDDRRSDGYVYARVIDVQPIYRYVRVTTPRRECWDEQVPVRLHRRRDGTAAATVAGGVIGGAIGHQFGDGNGREAMTILGALLGSAIAHEEASGARHGDYYYARARVRTVERCATRYTSREERRIEGYHVTYVYAGQKYATRTPRDPGNRIRVRVAVTPA